MSALERRCFGDIWEGDVDVRAYYCRLRNCIVSPRCVSHQFSANVQLNLWESDVARELSWTHVKEALESPYSNYPNTVHRFEDDCLGSAFVHRLAKRILAFLDRWSYTNFGVYVQAPSSSELSDAVVNLTKPKNVVIVGAGLSGIACAQQLARFGCTVTMIEASVERLLRVT